jgi:hypothetical protein
VSYSACKILVVVKIFVFSLKDRADEEERPWGAVDGPIRILWKEEIACRLGPEHLDCKAAPPFGEVFLVKDDSQKLTALLGPRRNFVPISLGHALTPEPALPPPTGQGDTDALGPTLGEGFKEIRI